jgi:ABC-type Mn2+/Zn2+ transport system ATPase subunit
MTILMVNHDLAAMRKYIQHVLWLHEGKLTQGNADELLTRDKLEEMLKLQFS